MLPRRADSLIKAARCSAGKMRMSEAAKGKAAVQRRPRPRVAKGPKRPQYFESRDLDRMMIMFVALMSEVSAIRDRLDTHEGLAELDRKLTRAEVEAYKLTEARAAERDQLRQGMLNRVFRALKEEQES